MPDPANPNGSPYVGMGNNPAIRVDPDGKMDTYGLTYRIQFQLAEREVAMENQRRYSSMENVVWQWPKNAVEKAEEKAEEQSKPNVGDPDEGIGDEDEAKDNQEDPGVGDNPNLDGEKDEKAKTTEANSSPNGFKDAVDLITKAIVDFLFDEIPYKDGETRLSAPEVTPFVSVSVSKEMSAGTGGWGSVTVTNEGLYASAGGDLTLSGPSATLYSVSITAGCIMGPIDGQKGYSLGSSAGLFFVGYSYSNSATGTITAPTIQLGNTRSFGFTLSTSSCWLSSNYGYTFKFLNF